MHAKNAVVLTISLSPEQLDQALGGKLSREEQMVSRYGEACQKKTAAMILGCKSPSTITAMLADGRLRSACGGERVDVRSICSYIESRPEANRAVRLRGQGKKAYV